MLKSELIETMTARHPHFYAKDVEKIVTAILEEIARALDAAGRVELRGFGALSVRQHEAREGRNPRSGAAVEISARSVVRFKPGKEMRERLNASAKRG